MKFLLSILAATLWMFANAQSLGLVSPNNGIRGKSVIASIAGNGTNFTQGPNTVWISQDTFIIYGTNVSAFANNFLIATFQIPASSACGAHDIHVSNTVDSVMTKLNGFIVNCPQIMNIQPSNAFLGDQLNITISASFTDFTQASNSVLFTNGTSTITPIATAAQGSGTLMVTLAIPDSVECDFYNIQINNASGFFEDTTAFEVKCFICDTQEIAINPGWNIISSYVIPDSANMLYVIDNISADILIVKDYLGQTVVPAFGINIIGDWHVEQGYKLKAVNATTLAMSCTAVDPTVTPISIVAGWNMVAYLRKSNMNIANAVSGIVGDILVVKDVNGNTYIPQFNINNIGNMKPGQGYMIKASNSTTLTYPANN